MLVSDTRHTLANELHRDANRIWTQRVAQRPAFES